MIVLLETVGQDLLCSTISLQYTEGNELNRGKWHLTKYCSYEQWLRTFSKQTSIR